MLNKTRKFCQERLGFDIKQLKISSIQDARNEQRTWKRMYFHVDIVAEVTNLERFDAEGFQYYWYNIISNRLLAEYFGFLEDLTTKNDHVITFVHKEWTYDKEYRNPNKPKCIKFVHSGKAWFGIDHIGEPKVEVPDNGSLYEAHYTLSYIDGDPVAPGLLYVPEEKATKVYEPFVAEYDFTKES